MAVVKVLSEVLVVGDASFVGSRESSHRISNALAVNREEAKGCSLCMNNLRDP